jgi:hypothetical protein
LAILFTQYIPPFFPLHVDKGCVKVAANQKLYFDSVALDTIFVLYSAGFSEFIVV